MVSKEVLQKWVELLDERKRITFLAQSTPADMAYYHGIIASIQVAGYEVRVDYDNKTHKILPPSKR